MTLRLAILLVLALALPLALPAPLPAQPRGIGAYFTLVNTYLYAKGPRDGRRTLVRPHQAFDVVDVTVDAEKTLWFLIVYPAETTRQSGTGWTPYAPHELLSAQQGPVLVFSRIPAGTQEDFTLLRVPAGGVELLNESQSGLPFLALDWQRVRYQLEQPLLAWARSTAGLYRPGKNAGFLNRVHVELVARNLERDEQVRLLSGAVRIGDTVREVRWSLGDPLRAQEEPVGEGQRTVWQYPELTVILENDVVKQIN
jgi:hypothetical protein